MGVSGELLDSLLTIPSEELLYPGIAEWVGDTIVGAIKSEYAQKYSEAFSIKGPERAQKLAEMGGVLTKALLRLYTYGYPEEKVKNAILDTDDPDSLINCLINYEVWRGDEASAQEEMLKQIIGPVSTLTLFHIMQAASPHVFTGKEAEFLAFMTGSADDAISKVDIKIRDSVEWELSSGKKVKILKVCQLKTSEIGKYGIYLIDPKGSLEKDQSATDIKISDKDIDRMAKWAKEERKEDEIRTDLQGLNVPEDNINGFVSALEKLRQSLERW